MTYLGWAVLIVGALVVGAVAQWIMESDLPFRWIATSIGAFVGAAAASEWLFQGTTPEYEGFAIVPAVVGGLVVGLVVDVIAQWYARSRVGGSGVAAH